MKNDKVKGGLADKIPASKFKDASLDEGMNVEMEHTSDPEMAREIAADHLSEDPDYYKKLKKMEKSAFWSGFTKAAAAAQDHSFDEKSKRYVKRHGRTGAWSGPNHFMKDLKNHHSKGGRPHYSFDGEQTAYDPKDHDTHSKRVQNEWKRGKNAYMGHSEHFEDPKQELEAAKAVHGIENKSHEVRKKFHDHASKKRLKELQKTGGVPPLVRRLLQKANLKGHSRKGLGNTRLMKELRRLGL